MLFCCMAAALLLACSNDKSDGEGREPGVETELNGTQLGEGTTLYGLVTDTSGNPVQGVVVSDGYNCVETDANGVAESLTSCFPEADVSLVSGGQPVYYYMIAAE